MNNDHGHPNIKYAAKELQLLDSKKFEPVYFHGKTMLPFLREADELIAIPADVTQISPGDIVTYLNDDKFPTRRVIRDLKAINSFLIQGDNIPKIKFVVPYKLVIGKVVARKRKGNWIYPNAFLWKWTSLRIINRERLKYKLRALKQIGIVPTIKRFF